MIKWIREILGIDSIDKSIDTIDKNINESNSTTKIELIEIKKSIENLIPKKEIKNIEIADSFNMKNDI